ncbi:MAG: tetratricopeptide repeat protein [Chloroflexi bacterium]|nr:tetratricopeptide repeat protein [Chloroflexota bacterium]
MSNIDNEKNGFGQWLRQQRRALDLTQQDLADQVGCARVTLRKIENGKLKPSKDLAHILLEKVGISEPGSMEWLSFARGLADQPAKSTIPFPITLRNNLPVSMTTFIGREKEQTDVINLITMHRLVTLTGSGGVGKTRLSIHVASSLLSEYPIGIWLVELASLTDPALVPQHVCATLEIKPEGSLPALEALKNYLHSKKILLVLDNCEHLINASAQLCDALLRSCPELRVIASSREPMGIGGEHAYRVPSLTLPTSKSNLQIIQGSEAVRLFVERAAASQFNFELTEDNAPFIAQICQRLDGIALAIELAASRVKMFQVEQIVALLDNSFDLLTGGSRTALPRHQTLRALIDWSYNLLSEEEKILLQRLSIFMGGWGLKAAEAVCGNVATFDLLTHLVDKSLVSVDREHGSEVRYYLLETVRQYAHDKLAESEDIIHLRNLHLDYFLKTAEHISPELYTRKMPFWLDYLETDYANFHAALEWAQESDIEAGLRLSNSLYPFWYIRGGGRKEGIQWFEKYLTLSTAKQDTTRAWALFNYINLSSSITLQKLSSIDKKRIEESLRLAQELGDHACASRVLERYGIQEMIIGNFDAANDYLRQSLSEAHLADSDRLIGNATYRLGNVAYNRTDYQTARKFIEDSVEIFRKVGDLSWWALALNLLGLMSNDQGDWDTARSYFDEALSLALESRDRPYASVYLLNLGLIAFGFGDFDQGIFFLNQGKELLIFEKSKSINRTSRL